MFCAHFPFSFFHIFLEFSFLFTSTKAKTFRLRINFAQRRREPCQNGYGSFTSCDLPYNFTLTCEILLIPSPRVISGSNIILGLSILKESKVASSDDYIKQVYFIHSKLPFNGRIAFPTPSIGFISPAAFSPKVFALDSSLSPTSEKKMKDAELTKE